MLIQEKYQLTIVTCLLHSLSHVWAVGAFFHIKQEKININLSEGDSVNSKQKPSDTTSVVCHKSPLLGSSKHAIKNQTSKPTKTITTICHLLSQTYILFQNVIYFFVPSPVVIPNFIIINLIYDVIFSCLYSQIITKQKKKKTTKKNAQTKKRRANSKSVSIF